MGKKCACLFLCVIFANAIKSSHIRRKHQAINLAENDPDNNEMVNSDLVEEVGSRNTEPINADPIEQVCYGFTHSDVALPLPSYCKFQTENRNINKLIGWQKPIHCRPPYVNCLPGGDSDNDDSDNDGSDNGSDNNGADNNNTTVVTSTMKPMTPNKTKECIRICKLMTPEYHPVCGTDGITYVNPGHLICAMTCGIEVDFASMGACGNDNNSTTSKPPKPTSLVPPTAPKPPKPTSVSPSTTPRPTKPTSVVPPTPSTVVPPTTSKPPKPTSVVPPKPSTIVPPTPSTTVSPTSPKPPTQSTIVPPTPSTIVPPTTSKPLTPATIFPPTTTTPHGGIIIFPDDDEDDKPPRPRPTPPKPTTTSTTKPTSVVPPMPSTIIPQTTSKPPKPTSVVPPKPSTIVPPTPSTIVPPTPSTTVPPTTSKPPTPSTIVPSTTTTPHGGIIIFPDDDEDDKRPTPRPTPPPKPTTTSTTTVRTTTMTSTTSTSSTVKPITTTISTETIEACVRDCRHVTSKWNPVCGTDGVTYINPLHLVCVKYCGVNVAFASVGPCANESSTLEPEKDEDSTTKNPSLKPHTVEQCVHDCGSVTSKENPVCGSDGVTYLNPLHLVCVKYCGVDVSLASKGPCNGGTVTVSPPTTPPTTTKKPGPLPDKVSECIRSCPVTSEFNPVCGTNGQTYTNPGRFICARQCGVDVNMLFRGPCRDTTTSSTTTTASNITTTTTASPIPDKVAECIKSCPVTAEYNPVCGTNGITYTNPGRFFCARQCGVDVDMRYRSPCRSTTTSSTTVSVPITTTTPATSSITPEAFKQCMTPCKATSEYNPVCGTNGVTFPNMGTLTCAQRCGIDVKLATYGKCSSLKPRQKRENIPKSDEYPEPNVVLSPYFGLNCKEPCLTTKEFSPVCGSDFITYVNPSVLRCEQLCGKNVTEMRQGHCDPSMTTTASTPVVEIPEAA